MKNKKIIYMLTALLVAPIAQADLVKKTSGRAPDKNLKIKQSGVPQLELYQTKKVNGKEQLFRLKNIPRINLGEEPVLTASDLTKIALPDSRKLQLADLQELPKIESKEIQSLLQLKHALAQNPQQFPLGPKAEPFKTPAAVANPKLDQPALNQVAIKDLTLNELKMLQALIFLEIQKNYPMALGLFAELLDDAPEFKTEAIYQIGVTSYALGLYSEYQQRMFQVLEGKDRVWQKRAATSLAEKAGEGDLELVEALDPQIAELKIDLQKADQYQLNRAKYYLESGDLKTSLAAVEKIEATSPLAQDARFMAAILQYRSGKVPEAIVKMTQVLNDLEKQSAVPELKTIAALTLGRLLFQIGDYKGAFKAYLKVDKAHPEWPQAMIEEAWAQILSGDYEGAAGNMFSLHTDFFKNTFAPESYVVRAVSYLNLCQFGDGAKVVQDLKRRYSPMQKVMSDFQTAHKEDADYYETVKVFLRDQNSKEINGLPRSLVWSLARHPSFMTEQKYINSLEEQISRYNKITMSLITREKYLLSEQNALRSKLSVLAKKQKGGEISEEQKELETRLLSFRIQHSIVKKARTAIKDIRAQGLARVEKEKATRKERAAKAIAARFKTLSGALTASLDQTDILQYELYAGAGEHLRYQAAGGEITPTEASGLKPEENKQLKWEFKGEVWQDELGHYRSSLKNVCPQVENSNQEQVSSVNQ